MSNETNLPIISDTCESCNNACPFCRLGHQYPQLQLEHAAPPGGGERRRENRRVAHQQSRPYRRCQQQDDDAATSGSRVRSSRRLHIPHRKVSRIIALSLITRPLLLMFHDFHISVVTFCDASALYHRSEPLVFQHWYFVDFVLFFSSEYTNLKSS